MAKGAASFRYTSIYLTPTHFIFNKQHRSHGLVMLMMMTLVHLLTINLYTLSSSAHIGPSWKLTTLCATPNKLEAFQPELLIHLEPFPAPFERLIHFYLH